jgi:ribulose-phosphate 3-epimerase
MIADPLEKVAEYAAAGADIITIHPEACQHPHRVLQQMRGLPNANDPARGIVRGAALNPGTPLETLDPLLDELEFILLLAVNPGWGGQKFIPSTFRRITQAQQMIADSGREILLGVDGGITRANIAEVAKTGVDFIVTGSAVFDGKAAEENARFMMAAVKL